MYVFKKEFRDGIVSKYKLVNIAKEIGISTVQLSRIINGKYHTKKPLAYCITKYLDNTKEIDYFFERL